MINFAFNSTEGIHGVQLGGGEKPQFRPNLDTKANSTVDKVVDFTQPLPLADNEYDLVFGHYVLQRISPEHIPGFLKECYRIAKPGAKILFGIPDTEARIKFLKENSNQNLLVTASELLYGTDPDHTWRSYFDPMIVQRLFSEAGFENIQTRCVGEPVKDIVLEANKPTTPGGQTLVSQNQPETTQGGLKIRKLGETSKETPTRPESTPKVEVPQLYESVPVEERFNRLYFDGGTRYGGYKPLYSDSHLNEVIFRNLLQRKPESVLELGCARGYILKRFGDSNIPCYGYDVSKHCWLTRAYDGVAVWDITKTWPSCPVGFPYPADLCYSLSVLEHIPERDLPNVLREMKKHARRHVHAICFGEGYDPSDKTICTLRPKDWWRTLFSSHGITSYEILERRELEAGQFPKEVLEGDGKLKVNIGSFTVMSRWGWENLDIHDLTQYAQQNGFKFRQCDIRGGLPYQSGIVDLIFSSHCLEHITYREGLSLLRDCRRIIRPEGCMRILVPDARKLMSMYCGDQYDGDLSLFDEMNEGCASSPTAAGKLWSLLHENHLACYDGETLLHSLKESGWIGEAMRFREGHPQIQKECQDMHPDLSLFVECKPKIGE